MEVIKGVDQFKNKKIDFFLFDILFAFKRDVDYAEDISIDFIWLVKTSMKVFCK